MPWPALHEICADTQLLKMQYSIQKSITQKELLVEDGGNRMQHDGQSYRSALCDTGRRGRWEANGGINGRPRQLRCSDC